MELHIKLGLLLAVTTSVVAEVSYYVPQLSFKQLPGKLTGATFILDEPQCIFQQYNTSTVWLVVALNSVVPNVTDANLSNPVGFSSFTKNGYYFIYPRTASTYPCSDMAPPAAALLPVGIDSSCNNVTFCNGPLKNPGPYRVKFVVLNSNNTVVKSTRWSNVINMKTVMNTTGLDPGPQRRSAGMIVIVVILSVLLAILLACLIAALAVGSKDICWCRTIDNEGFLAKEEVEQYVMNTTYLRHNLYTTHSRLSSRQSSVYTVYK